MDVPQSGGQLDDVVPDQAFGKEAVLSQEGLLPKLLVLVLRVRPGSIRATVKEILNFEKYNIPLL